jgi:hypothetical protein
LKDAVKARQNVALKESGGVAKGGSLLHFSEFERNLETLSEGRRIAEGSGV